jgi:hypothetical protein
MWSLLGFRTESVWNIEFNVSILGTCPCLLWVYSLVKQSILTKRSTTLYPPGLTHKTCSTSPVVIQTQGVAHEFLWHEPRRHYTRNVCERIEASISHSHPVETWRLMSWWSRKRHIPRINCWPTLWIHEGRSDYQHSRNRWLVETRRTWNLVIPEHPRWTWWILPSIKVQTEGLRVRPLTLS